MNTFPQLTDAEIDAILKYVETYPEPGAGGAKIRTKVRQRRRWNLITAFFMEY